jgi:hypothetical protein
MSTKLRIAPNVQSMLGELELWLDGKFNGKWRGQMYGGQHFAVIRIK